MRAAPSRLASRARAAGVALAIAAGCAKAPAPETCGSHADCPAGTTCQRGVCQAGLTLDFAAPAAARSYASGGVPVSVTVTGATPSAIQLVVDDVPVATLVAPFQGTLDTSTLTEASHVLVAVAEMGGRVFVSPPRTVDVDRSAPATPGLAGATTNAADPVTVSGSLAADAGAPVTLTVYEGEAVKATGIVPVAGFWSASVTLAEGSHALTAQAVDAAGNTSPPSPTAMVVIDRTPPPVPVVAPLTTGAADPVSVSGTIAADGGTAVTIAVLEGATVKAAGVVPAGGAWTASFALGEGSHGLTARAADAAGNVSALSAPGAVLVDRTPPATPGVASRYTAAADPVAVSGTWTADAGSPVTITVYEGATALLSGLVPAAGSWSGALALGEGSHALVAVATDAAGNASNPSAAGTVFVDRTAPAPPSVFPATTAAADPVTVSGAWAPDSGAPVRIGVYDGATLVASDVVPGGGGAWSAQIALTEGGHALTAVATDAAGNASAASASASVVVDRTAPAVPTVTARTTSDLDPVTVSGTLAADLGTAVTVTVYEGAVVKASGIVPSGTSWSTGLSLAEGAHALTARAMDAAGNPSGLSSPATVLVDRTAPAAPTVTAATTSAADPVTVTGTWAADTGSPVTLTLYEGAVVKATGIVPSAGAWAAPASLAEGSHALTAQATDAAGNSSALSSAAVVVVDRTGPPVPAVSSAVTGAADPVTVSGTIAADGGTSVTITVYEGATVKATGIVPAGGAWSTSFPLGEGSHGLTARATDAAGNASALSPAGTVLVDRTPPATPTVASAYTSATDPVTVSGTWTADAGSPVTITVSEGATPLAAGLVPAAGAWSGAVALGEGSHALVAVATDAAGNVSNPSAAGTVFVDRTAPAAPSIAPATTNATDPVTVTGTWPTDGGAPVTITVYEGATVKAAGAVPNGAGAWSAAVTLAEGSHTLTARVTDAAGNGSSPSSPATIVVDRTLPPVPTVGARTTNQADPVTVSGTIAADAGTAITVTVYEGATVKAVGVVPSGLAWSADVALAEGSHTLTARALDAAGNDSGLSLGATVVVDRTAPATPAVTAQVTSAADPVTVSGTWAADGGTPVTITVTEGAAELGSGIVPGGGAWSAAFALAEGTHLLAARATDAAGNASGLSASAAVVVDRTAPTITAQAPAASATNVWTRDPITVTFSEPMEPAQVTDATVALVRAGGAALAKTAALSPDRRTLTVTPTTLPSVPDTFTLTLNGLTDAAGNGLPTASWSWSAPEWQDLGVPLGAASRSSIVMSAMAVGPAGLPVLVAQWMGTSTGSAFVRYTGDAAQPWVNVPMPPFTGIPFSGALAVNGQEIVAAFGTSSSGADVWAARYDGTSWLGAAVLDVSQTNDASSPSVGLDADGAPYVAWVETVGTVSRVFARQGSGAAWSLLGAGALSSATVPASAPRAAAGSTRVTWTETDGAGTTAKTSAWSGSSWSTVAGGFAINGLTNGVPLATNAGTMVLLTVTATGRVQVLSWVPYAYPVPGHWLQIGADLNAGAGAGSDAVFALDPAGEPVVAWYEAATTTGTWVRRHDSVAGWQWLTAGALSSRPLHLAVSSSGVVVLAKAESLGLSTGFRVLRYNR